MILPDARAVVRAVEHSHAMARTGAPQSTNPTASSNSSRTRLPTACAGPTRLASDTCSLAGSRIRSSWEQLVFRRLASAAVNHGVHFAVSLPRERRMCLESGGIQPSTEVAMSEVTLEADIRGHDKNDANDPKRKSWNCLVDPSSARASTERLAVTANAFTVFRLTLKDNSDGSSTERPSCSWVRPRRRKLTGKAGGTTVSLAWAGADVMRNKDPRPSVSCRPTRSSY
jgi:hypothetical protein